MIMTTNYVLHFEYEFEIYYLDMTISNDRVGYESIAVSQRCILVAVRGERGRSRRRETEETLPDVSYNLIPERAAYET